ncbi:hypothetical protein AMATHDRAFT_66189 [Amanita thiersii Skay4041]|uniref:DUF6534 domain-containing protein n=1 Tax=Amanita thiersii Skay4041 TaxID=703135 RepID=A0A2A9NBZ8_9AGAR|nr:hypothetical protein AMATHDRAFT_66189 [Amanita thiersii Skay4041]
MTYTQEELARNEKISEKIASVSLQVGNSLSWCLLGILTIQVYFYYLAFPKDGRRTKAAVYTLYCIETIQTVVILVDNTVDFFKGNYVGIRIAVPLLCGLAALITQCIYANRIQIITASRFLTWSIRVMSIFQFLGALLFAIGLSGPYGLLPPPPITDVVFGANLTPPISGYIWTGFSAICDISICIVMSYSLLNKRKIVMSGTRKKIDRLVSLVIEAGTITALVNFSALILLATSGFTGSAHIVPMIILSKVYANSVLMLFNNRKAYGGGEDNNKLSVVEASTLRFAAKTMIDVSSDPELDSCETDQQTRLMGCEAEQRGQTDATEHPPV